MEKAEYILNNLHIDPTGFEMIEGDRTRFGFICSRKEMMNVFGALTENGFGGFGVEMSCVR
jgi:hypothetical protein